LPILYEDTFGTSTQKVVSAQKIPTAISCYIFDEKWQTNVEGQTFYVGTKVTIVVTLYATKPGYVGLDGKQVKIYRQIGDQPAELVKTVTIGSYSDHGKPAGGGADLIQTLFTAGAYKYWAVFDGDDQYEGCEGEGVEAFACNC